jgi:hypothetical protein
MGTYFKAISYTLGTLVLGLLSCAFQSWTDYRIGIHLLTLPNGDLGDLYAVDKATLIWNSYYSGFVQGGFWTVLQTITLLLLAGFGTTVALKSFLNSRKITTKGIILIALIWLLKFPVPFEYAHFISLYRGALAW